MSDADADVDRPNVLLVVADDQRFDTVSALGDDRIETPTLDSLVERGCAFTRHHNLGSTHGAVCVPARSMIHSGRSLFRLEGPGGMTTVHPTLGEAFGDAGYRTFGTGKWHNGREAFNRSFAEGDAIYFGGMGEHWNLPVCSRYPLGEYPDPRPARVDLGSGTVNPVQQVYDRYASGTHSSELFADAAIDFVEDAAGEDPFFASLAWTAPHDPRTAPGEYLERYDPDDLPTPESFVPEHPFNNGAIRGRDEDLEAHPRDPERVRRHLADYYAMITHLDAQLGRVLDALDRTGVREETLVVVTADHGLAVGRHGLMGKQNVYDHSLRVPLLFAGPGVPAGERRDGLSAHPDLYPTLCDLAGLDGEPPATVDGASLAPAIRGEDTHRDAVFAAYGDCQRALRTDGLKLHEYRVDGTERVRLYDLDDDPAETTDRSAERPDDVTRLRERLRDRQRAAEDPLADEW
jgi:arylsulfatase A-like enzyme